MFRLSHLNNFSRLIFYILAAIEVKTCSSVNAGDFKHLSWFCKTRPGKPRKITSVVYQPGDWKLTFGTAIAVELIR